MTKLEKKIISIINAIAGIGLILFMIIFTPCYTELMWKGPRGDLFTSLVIIMVFIPFLGALVCFLIAYIFKEFTTQDMINALEKGFRKGTMSLETYQKSYQDVMLFELETKKIKAQTNLIVERTKHQVEAETQAVEAEILAAKNQRLNVASDEPVAIEEPLIDEPQRPAPAPKTRTKRRKATIVSDEPLTNWEPEPEPEQNYKSPSGMF